MLGMTTAAAAELWGDSELPVVAWPTHGTVDLRHRLLLAAAGRGEETDEATVALAATALEQVDRARVASGRPATERARRAIADGARMLLADEPRSSLVQLARASRSRPITSHGSSASRPAAPSRPTAAASASAPCSIASSTASRISPGWPPTSASPTTATSPAPSAARPARRRRACASCWPTNAARIGNSESVQLERCLSRLWFCASTPAATSHPKRSSVETSRLPRCGAPGAQSILLTAERRMGKTSVLHRMLAQPPAGFIVLNRNLQPVATPEEFITTLITDAERAVPGLFKRTLAKRLSDAGVQKIGVSKLSVRTRQRGSGELEDGGRGHIFHTYREPPRARGLPLGRAAAHAGEHSRHDRRARCPPDPRPPPGGSRDIPTAGMVFSGSVGLHHVVDELRAQGGMWAPVHDMIVVDLPPLQLRMRSSSPMHCSPTSRSTATTYRWWQGPSPARWTRSPTTSTTSSSSCATASRQGSAPPSMRRGPKHRRAGPPRPAGPVAADAFVDRVGSYYPAQDKLVRAMLDAVAVSAEPLDVAGLQGLVAAQQTPPWPDELKALLVLLCKDHYLLSRPGFAFKLSLVRRAWAARRSGIGHERRRPTAQVHTMAQDPALLEAITVQREPLIAGLVEAVLDAKGHAASASSARAASAIPTFSPWSSAASVCGTTTSSSRGWSRILGRFAPTASC